MRVKRRKAYGRYWEGILRIMTVTGWSQESRVDVQMKDRARAEAKIEPPAMEMFRSCLAVR
jgi:hypothetical protein